MNKEMDEKQILKEIGEYQKLPVRRSKIQGSAKCDT